MGEWSDQQVDKRIAGGGTKRGRNAETMDPSLGPLAAVGKEGVTVPENNIEE
jgi:hypothetical protein